MKVERLTESKEVVLKKHLTEDVDQVRARVREFLEERLDAATDNIAIELAAEVEGYDPDWCYPEGYGNFVDQLEKARLTFLNKLESVLFAEAPMNEALKEAVDMSAMRYAVIKPNGEYAGVPCESVDEARELAAQEEGRVVFKLSKVLFGESYDKDGNHEKCEKCGTLLNDMGTCPKCDDGEEDYGDEELDEAAKSVFERDALKVLAYVRKNPDCYDEDTDIEELLNDLSERGVFNIPAKAPGFTCNDVENVTEEEAEKYIKLLITKTQLKSQLDLDESYNSLHEEMLNEGPGLRSLGRKIANKFNPAGARNREVGGHEKDEKSYREKKAPPVLARDFSTKSQGYKFYPNVEGSPVMNFDQWTEKYASVAEGTPEYAQWYNAIVTDADGYYIRRGSENLKGKLVKYVPGDNDEILKMYRVEPYTYYAGKKGKPDPVPPKPAPVPPTSDDEDDGGKKPPKDPKDPKKRTRKAPVPVADKDLNRFIQLCRLTSFRVFANANPETQLTVNELKGITTDTLDQYSVSTKYQKKLVNLADWMQTAKRLNFLEKFEREIRGSLNESLLTEAPRISFDDADLMNPDSIDFKSMLKKAHDKENAEVAAKADAEKVAELKNKAEQALSDIASFDSWEDQLDAVHSIVVPNEGKADSLGGELVRAIVRIIYRDRNDGDKFFQGYGLETCGSSAMFLYNNGFDTQIDHIIENARYYEDDDDAYSDAINKLGQLVLDRIQNEPDLLTTSNDVDSRDVDYTYIEEQQPTYDFEFYGSDDIVELVDAEILNSWKLKDYVEQQLKWNSVCRGCEVERPWTHYDHSVQVTGLTRDGLDYVEQELFNDPDSFWQDLVDEYSDELEELRNDHDDDYEEDDIDESIVMESANNYYFQHGDEVLEGMNGNLSDKEPDYQIKYLNRIAKKLGLKRVEDLVLFCDDEWVYDPTMFDNRFFTLPEQPNEFNVNGVTFIAAKEFNQIWLYFRNEEDGSAYLGYCDAQA